MTDNPDGDGPIDTGCGYADPAAFEDGDEIDSAAIDEPDGGYQPPDDPDAEPDDGEPDAGEPGGGS